MDRPIRTLLAKPTHDSHDRGVRYLARVLRDAGFEVVFMNFLLPEDVVNAATQEDVDVIGISSSAGGHMPVFADVAAMLRQRGLDDVLLIGGGIIPASDAKKLQQEGVGRIFGPGSDPEEIQTYIREHSRSVTGIHP
ncbi:cobalamin B12-binding domain-containing protein [Nocardia australiensis]|uniref:cobalamin B12-binding domain-containing protein n=1 Tax=Nocardia australiensis TaxID=2887191 RepID=UPI001D13C37A|nr:cobalamin-dependent protein [Nocardia australiensis]